MPAYLIQADTNQAGRTSVAGADCVVVHAESVGDALAMAKSKASGNSNSAWDDAEVTQIGPAQDLAGFSLRVAVTLPADAIAAPEERTIIDHKVIATADETIDDLGRRMARELNDIDAINGAAYNAQDRVLTVASPAGGDMMGDYTLQVFVMPPDVTNPRAEAVPGFVLSTVHEGSKNSPLMVVFAGSEYRIPKIAGAFGRSK